MATAMGHAHQIAPGQGGLNSPTSAFRPTFQLQFNGTATMPQPVQQPAPQPRHLNVATDPTAATRRERDARMTAPWPDHPRTTYRSHVALAPAPPAMVSQRDGVTGLVVGLVAVSTALSALFGATVWM